MSRSAESLSDEWGTPDHLFRRLNERWNFAFDLAASMENAKLHNFWTLEDDALSKPWRVGTLWLNPPYSRGNLLRFMRKARSSALEHGCTVVCLVPSYTGEGWWHETVVAPAGELLGLTRPAPATVAWHYRRLVVEVEHIKGRLRFVGPSGVRFAARFSSSVVSFIGRGGEG